MYAIGAGGGGDIDAFVDEKGGAIAHDVLELPGQVEELSTGHFLGPELDERDTAVDGGCNAAGQGTRADH